MTFPSILRSECLTIENKTGSYSISKMGLGGGVGSSRESQFGTGNCSNPMEVQ